MSEFSFNDVMNLLSSMSEWRITPDNSPTVVCAVGFGHRHGISGTLTKETFKDGNGTKYRIAIRIFEVEESIYSNTFYEYEFSRKLGILPKKVFSEEYCKLDELIDEVILNIRADTIQSEDHTTLSDVDIKDIPLDAVLARLEALNVVWTTTDSCVLGTNGIDEEIPEEIPS